MVRMLNGCTIKCSEIPEVPEFNNVVNHFYHQTIKLVISIDLGLKLRNLDWRPL